MTALIFTLKRMPLENRRMAEAIAKEIDGSSAIVASVSLAYPLSILRSIPGLYDRSVQIPRIWGHAGTPILAASLPHSSQKPDPKLMQ